MLYITQVNNEITKLIMLKLVATGFKFESLHKFVNLNDAAGAQIATINSANVISTSALPEMQPALAVVEEVQELIKKFFLQSLPTHRKSSTADSASKVDRRSSSKANSNM